MSFHLITILSPAYGADYKSKKALIEAFENGKDFYLHSEGNRPLPCSIEDFRREESDPYILRFPIQFRYGNMRKTFIYNGKK